jgi:hypothetical protein
VRHAMIYTFFKIEYLMYRLTLRFGHKNLAAYLS